MSDETGLGNSRLCHCGRSATGFCNGLHKLSEQEWNEMLIFDMNLHSDDKADDPGL